jgi:hypothetical protein
LVVIANRVDGQLTTLLDLKSTVVLGAIAGGILGLISLFRRR